MKRPHTAKATARRMYAAKDHLAGACVAIHSKPVLDAVVPVAVFDLSAEACEARREMVAAAVRSAEQPVIAKKLPWSKCIVKDDYLHVADAIITSLALNPTKEKRK